MFSPHQSIKQRRLQEYERIKRANRRRLMGAVVVALIAGLGMWQLLSMADNSAAPESIAVSSNIPSNTAASSHTGTTSEAYIGNTQAVEAEADRLPEASATDAVSESDVRLSVLPNPMKRRPLAWQEGQTQIQTPSGEQAVSEAVQAQVDVPVKFLSKVKPANPTAAAPRRATPGQTPSTASRNTASSRRNTNSDTASSTTRPSQESARNTASGSPPRDTGRSRSQTAATSSAQTTPSRTATAAAAENRTRSNNTAAANAPATPNTGRSSASAGSTKPAAQASGSPSRNNPSTASSGSNSRAEAILNSRNPRTQDKQTGTTDPNAVLEGNNRRRLIQVGVYSDENRAREVQRSLAGAGISAYVASVEGSNGKQYRVRTGTYPTAAAADQAMAKIKMQGLDGIFLDR